MEPGCSMPALDMSGCPGLKEVLHHMLLTDIGLIQNTETPGYPTILGDGRRSITAVGFTMISMDGSGCPIQNGLRPGWPGEVVVDTMDGLC